MTNHHFETQQKTQTNHFSHKQNETNEAAFLAIIVFISLLIFVFQS
jgi:hypothetical protein